MKQQNFSSVHMTGIGKESKNSQCLSYKEQWGTRRGVRGGGSEGIYIYITHTHTHTHTYCITHTHTHTVSHTTHTHTLTISVLVIANTICAPSVWGHKFHKTVCCFLIFYQFSVVFCCCFYSLENHLFCWFQFYPYKL